MIILTELTTNILSTFLKLILVILISLYRTLLTKFSDGIFAIILFLGCGRKTCNWKQKSTEEESGKSICSALWKLWIVSFVFPVFYFSWQICFLRELMIFNLDPSMYNYWFENVGSYIRKECINKLASGHCHWKLHTIVTYTIWDYCREDLWLFIVLCLYSFHNTAFVDILQEPKTISFFL